LRAGKDEGATFDPAEEGNDRRLGWQWGGWGRKRHPDILVSIAWSTLLTGRESSLRPSVTRVSAWNVVHSTSAVRVGVGKILKKSRLTPA
jgi:hypothetical protein